MLRTLIYSQPARTSSWLGSTAFSTVTHGALIALAVAGTTNVVASVHEDRAGAPERVTYVETARLLSTRTAKASVDRKSAPAKPAAPTVPNPAALTSAIDLASVQIPDIAAPDLTAVTDAWLAAPDALTGRGLDLASKVVERMALKTPDGGVFTEEMVERTVQARHGNPAPRYPSALEDMQIEGDFVVKFVVDSTGSVDENKIEFPSSMHRLFADAVRSALRRSRYFPALFAGRAVPQVVIQEFKFTMGRGGRR